MKLDVPNINRLLKALFRYDTAIEDYDLLEFYIQEKIDYVKAYCNISHIDESMNTQIAKMVIGEFLYQKYLLGGADALGIETYALLSGWTEDDTSLEFDNTGAQSGDTLIINRLNDLRLGDRVFLMRNRSVTPV